jgi:tetraacyldisaccharide 4'-kinase
MAWRAPSFWRAPPTALARALAPLGEIYGAITAARMARRGARVAAPVICVGAFTAGGAGKTPAVIALARLLKEMGERPFVVSRGYGGREQGPFRVDPVADQADAVGDEPLEIAASVPCIVAKDRVAGARAAVAQGASVVLLDDGMQSPSLVKVATLAVVDGEVWFDNGFCLPAGPLRAPVARQAPCVGGLLVIGGAGAPPPDIAPLLGAAPRLSARMVPDAAAIARLTGRRALVFAGIGRPEKFATMLRGSGIDVAGLMPFADHRPYSDVDLALIEARCVRETLVAATTMKDLARIGAARAGDIFGARLVVVPAALEFDDEDAMRGWLAAALARVRS